MAKYVVTIDQTMCWDVVVYASNLKRAKLAAFKAMDNGRISEEPDYHSGYDISNVEELPLKDDEEGLEDEIDE